MTTTTTCPVCHREVIVRSGRLARHHGDLMRWSGRRWFRQTCKGSGRRVTPVVSGAGS